MHKTAYFYFKQKINLFVTPERCGKVCIFILKRRHLQFNDVPYKVMLVFLTFGLLLSEWPQYWIAFLGFHWNTEWSRPSLWSRGNIVTSHAAAPGSIPGRTSFLVEQHWFLILRWKTCLWEELQPWFLRLQRRACTWREYDDDDDVLTNRPIELTFCMLFSVSKI